MSELQQELKKKRPFEHPEQEMMLNLSRTADQVQNRFLRLFRKFELTPSQYNVLRILRGEGRPLPSLEIAERMIQETPAITGLIDRLEKLGLVQRTRCEEDRRVVFVSITDKGTELLSQLDTPVVELHQSLVSHMTNAEITQLNKLLVKARKGVGKLPEQ